MQWKDSTLRLGTSSWTAKGWAGKFYEAGMKPRDFIAEYAKHFSTVEVDASFYGVPKKTTLEHWRDSTPKGFLFAAKAPRAITHDRFLVGCGQDLDKILAAMDVLGEKAGPLLFQFPYFAKRTGITLQAFLDRLAPFLKLLPKEEDRRFAVEVRNKAWLTEPLLDLLATHNIALTLIDHPWMANPNKLFGQQGIITGRFAYVRWLGDRKAIEKITTVFNQVIVDRTNDIERWVDPIQKLLDKKIQVFGYVNNHYAGYAPENVSQLQDRLTP